MPSLWKPECDCGIEAVDIQHRQIVDAASALYAAVRAGRDPKVPEVLEVLKLYATTHFHDEEGFLERLAGYPDLSQQRRAHRQFVATSIESCSILTLPTCSNSYAIGSCVTFWASTGNTFPSRLRNARRSSARKVSPEGLQTRLPGLCSAGRVWFHRAEVSQHVQHVQDD